MFSVKSIYSYHSKFTKKFYLLFFKKMKAQTFEFIKMKNYQTIMGGYNDNLRG